MYALFVVVVFALAALATPLERRFEIAPKRRASDGGFSLDVERASNDRMLSGAAVVAKTRAKFSKHYHGSSHGVSQVRLAAANGTVAADPTQYDQEYLSPIQVGGQLLRLDLDSGSSDLWVFSSELPAAEQAGHDVYNPNRSSTARYLANQSWYIAYGDGSSASGDVWTDCVVAGGTVVENQAVETAGQVSAEFLNDSNTDGILGLAFDSLNSVEPTLQHTFLSNAIAQGLPQPLFTADLRRQAAGSYDFGFVNASKYTGGLFYSPVNSGNGFWELNTTGYAYETKNGTNPITSLVANSICDTGTSISFLNGDVVTGYYALVSGAAYNGTAGGWVFPCSAADSLPSLKIELGGFVATIPGPDIAYAPVADGSSSCFGGVQPNTGLDFQILGDTFLKNVFAVFNAGVPPKLGFAQKSS